MSPPICIWQSLIPYASQDASKKDEIQKEMEERKRPKPKPKFDPITGKWVVMNWDGTISGVPGGEKRNFAELDRQLSGLTGDDDSSRGNSLPSSRMSSTRSTTTHDHEPVPRCLIDKEAGANSPFARVDAVASESPAQISGLLEEDLIVSFGPLHAENNDHLRAITNLVLEAAEQERTIEIHVLRKNDDSVRSSADDIDGIWRKTTLQLKPRPWHGRGLLGCHIVPYSR